MIQSRAHGRATRFTESNAALISYNQLKPYLIDETYQIDKVMHVMFDTFKAVKELSKHGFSQEQSEAITEVLKGVHGEANLATKQDLKELGLKLSGDIKIVRWMVGLIVLVEVTPWLLKVFSSVPMDR